MVAYKLAGGELRVVENGKLSDQVIGIETRLESSQSDRLLTIFINESTYGGCPARCFDPHVGYVFYDKEDKVIGHSSICLSCNWMKTSPQIGGGGFSIKGSTALSNIEHEILVSKEKE